MQRDAPELLEPVGLIPLAPFARSLGYTFPVFTSQETWDGAVRYGPHSALTTLGTAVENALNSVGSARADRAAIDFKWWQPSDEGAGKERKVRLRATLYLSKEQGIWILLAPAPERFRPGVSRAS